MDVAQFKEFADASLDFIADYCENIRQLPVLPNVEPGYLSREFPQTAPQKGESWKHIMEDINTSIVPGLTQWHSPYFHAFFPTGQSYPAIIGELFMAGIGAVASNWESSPAVVELEVRVMDWLAKILGLPEEFLNSSDGPGGGVIQTAASESTLVGLLVGKHRKLQEVKSSNPNLQDCGILGKLVAYTSKESNSSVEKSGIIASVKMKLLPTDADGSLRGSVLEEAIRKDKEDGLIPCCVVASLGTTGTCAFDNIEELGKICQRENMWLHIDAAYAGTALSCPEYRYLLNGIEYVDSFNFNAHKWFLVNGDCSALWFRNTKQVEDAFKLKNIVDLPQFLPELEHWQIPDHRRFRALKLWFVIRIYGVQGIQKHVRHHISLAKHFRSLVESDLRFEVITSNLGVICFKLRQSEAVTQRILENIAKRRKIYIMPYYYKKQLLFRFVICSRFITVEDVECSWREISSQTSEVLKTLEEA
ncbi:3,4-dihydroxyphenylacetaldehyde synthase-like [Sitophilus oryzae]|uniref:3,4-dihydroxyphenylacetaldehyde synthase-like n=1 Tax=Sitophilus oryzae TaxID=7048 RepID=A0A6J2X669_SITOR|nr:3,4-dihydroxyphenylacetaldehyde synthase-like [Sitophilus oryzae]